MKKCMGLLPWSLEKFTIPNGGILPGARDKRQMRSIGKKGRRVIKLGTQSGRAVSRNQSYVGNCKVNPHNSFYYFKNEEGLTVFANWTLLKPTTPH
jgi:hypothetical protein